MEKNRLLPTELSHATCWASKFFLEWEKSVNEFAREKKNKFFIRKMVRCDDIYFGCRFSTNGMPSKNIIPSKNHIQLYLYGLRLLFKLCRWFFIGIALDLCWNLIEIRVMAGKFGKHWYMIYVLTADYTKSNGR